MRLHYRVHKTKKRYTYKHSIEIDKDKERMASPKLTREIVYEKKAAKYEGMGIFAHKLRQFYEFYLIASFLFLKITIGKKFPPKQLKHEPVLNPLFLDYCPRTFSS